MLTELTVGGYRSLREIELPLGRLNVLVGANGCGKSNLYRSVFLLHAAAMGTLARTLAEEGGMPSALWAGARKKGPIRLHLGVALDDGFAYTLACGLPEANDLPGRFGLDPLLKEETITYQGATLLERSKSGVTLRDDQGKRVTLPMSLTRSESTLTQVLDPQRYPYVSALRETLRQWRFYHGFRTDADAPLRQPQIGVFTPALAHDGRDLAAALATIQEIGDADALARAVRQGLQGAILDVPSDDGARFRVRLHTPGLNRPLEATELSDGTLRFLCLLAALMSPRLPPLLALNEPETSLHPDLLPALAERIVDASRRTQLWVTTHSQPLADTIERLGGVTPLRLRLVDGETHPQNPPSRPAERGK